MEQQPRLPLWLMLANMALLTLAFVLGAALGNPLANSRMPKEQRNALELVYRKVLESHIAPPAPDELAERAIAGMVDGLDPYSHYYPPQQVPAYEESSTGHYQGIGAEIVPHGDDIVVHFPLPDSPAEAAGLQPGDRLLAVDGTALDTPDARARTVELVRGEAGTTVALSLLRHDRRLELEVERRSVTKACILWPHWLDRDRGLAYLHLSGFHPTADRELRQAIEAFEAQRELRGLVLDLRYNRGGDLEQCLDIARAFVADGVLATQEQPGEPDVVYRADAERCTWPKLPLVVLVNGGSASASEVLSGALQDHDRALIVGERTFGKAHVNTVYTWANHDFRLKLTTGRYRTPNGSYIERVGALRAGDADSAPGGIAPDIEAAPTGEAQRAATERILARDVPAKYAEQFEAVARRYGFEPRRGPAPASDTQLHAALNALQQRAGS